MIQEEFLKLGIPFHLVRGIPFLESALAKDVIAYLRLVLNNNDDLALARVYNTPRRRLSKRPCPIPPLAVVPWQIGWRLLPARTVYVS